MSSAGRPTFNPAMGGEPRSGQGGNKIFVQTKQISSRDLNSHTKLKIRQEGQGTKKEVQQRDLKSELLEKERTHFVKKQEDHLLLTEDRDEETKEEVDQEEERPKNEKNIDADDSDDSDDDRDSEDNRDDESEEDSEEDDTAELMKELERIQKEREQQAKQQEESLHKQKEEQVIKGNPLLNQDFSVKKRWYDDTVFKNQSRGEVKQQKRFINDTIRNDFHKKFLFKYVQ